LFAAERHNKIKQLILEYGKVDVNNLSDILAVSEVTIRKDLEKLEVAKFLIRTHGGAVIREDTPKEDIYLDFEDVPNIESKKMIGVFAAALVQDREAIFLGPGSTCLQIAKNIKDKKDIIVTTNNVAVMVELADCPSCRVLASGGELDSSEYGIMMTGETLIETIRQTYVNKAFVSIDGLNFNRGYMIRNEFLARLYQELKNHSDELIVAADHTKFGTNAYSTVGDLKFADKIISDQNAPHEYIKYFFENETQIFTTYPLK